MSPLDESGLYSLIVNALWLALYLTSPTLLSQSGWSSQSLLVFDAKGTAASALCSKINAVLMLTESFLRRSRGEEKQNKQKKSILRSSVTVVGAGGCIDFTLRALGRAPHYQ